MDAAALPAGQVVAVVQQSVNSSLVTVANFESFRIRGGQKVQRAGFYIKSRPASYVPFHFPLIRANCSKLLFISRADFRPIKSERRDSTQ